MASNLADIGVLLEVCRKRQPARRTLSTPSCRPVKKEMIAPTGELIYGLPVMGLRFSTVGPVCGAIQFLKAGEKASWSDTSLTSTAP